MKKNSIAFAVLAVISASAFATGSHHTPPVGGVSGAIAGGNVVKSASGSSASANGTGTASSQSANIGFAYTQVQSGGKVGATGYGQANAGTPGTSTANGMTSTNTGGKYGSVTAGGVSETFNSSFTKTETTGSGQANGAASGDAKSWTAGGAAFWTSGDGPKGSVAGSSDAQTKSSVASYGNGSAEQTGGMMSNWGGSASANITYQKTVDSDGVKGVADIKNAATNTYANAVSTLPRVSTQTGTGTGWASNVGSANANAVSSVKGFISKNGVN